MRHRSWTPVHVSCPFTSIVHSATQPVFIVHLMGVLFLCILCTFCTCDCAWVEDGELRRTLQSLACGKARVLTKQPKVLRACILDSSRRRVTVIIGVVVLWCHQLPQYLSKLPSCCFDKLQLILLISCAETMSVYLKACIIFHLTLVLYLLYIRVSCLQCFHTVGWASERTPGL